MNIKDEFAYTEPQEIDLMWDDMVESENAIDKIKREFNIFNVKFNEFFYHSRNIEISDRFRMIAEKVDELEAELTLFENEVDQYY